MKKLNILQKKILQVLRSGDFTAGEIALRLKPSRYNYSADEVIKALKPLIPDFVTLQDGLYSIDDEEEQEEIVADEDEEDVLTFHQTMNAMIDEVNKLKNDLHITLDHLVALRANMKAAIRKHEEIIEIRGKVKGTLGEKARKYDAIVNIMGRKIIPLGEALGESEVDP